MTETFRPETLEEAVKIRAEKGAMPFAGGTDLMVKYHYENGVVPKFGKPVIFIDRIEEIGCVERSGDTLRIGGGATLSQVMRHEETPGLLREAVRSIAAPALRNVGTMAGNLCNASPAGDSILALYALDARVELTGRGGSREMAVEDFVTGPGSTELREDELVSAIAVPLSRSDVSLFRKVGTRKANALTKVSIAGRAKLADGVVEEIAIAVGAVAPTVVRSREIEDKVRGKTLEEIKGIKEELFSSYERLVRPIDDQRSTAKYRKKVAMNLLRMFIEKELLGGA